MGLRWWLLPRLNGRSGAAPQPDRGAAHVDGKRRAKIIRHPLALLCSGEGGCEECVDSPARVGKLMLSIALDRVADYLAG